MEGTALLAIGGGYDLGLIEALGPVGMANIEQYVSAGGCYLGVCAGAYLACDRIEFDKGGPLEVLGERPLKFCSGIILFLFVFCLFFYARYCVRIS